MSDFLIYKSSAGSGKTTALVNIFVRLCLAGKSPETFKRILAITFTNKAANEMKERVISELARISELQLPIRKDDYAAILLPDQLQITEEEIVSRAKRTFRLMLHEYGDLALSTIDKFNLRLIRSFSRELGLKADFEIELDERTLFSESVDRVIALAGTDDTTTNHLVSYLNQNHEDEKKIDIVGDLNNLFNLVMSEDAIEALDALRNIREDDYKTISVQIRQSNRSYIEKVKNTGHKALELLARNGIIKDDLKLKSTGWHSYFSKMIKFDGGEKISLTASQKGLLDDPDFAHSHAKAATRSIIASITPLLNDLLKEAINLNEEGYSDYSLQKAISKQIHLIALIGKLRESIETITEERNILPITASNRIVSEALRDEPVAFLYEHIGNRYKHMLIDEFQDTSELQWLNLLPLVEDAIAQGNTALIVGDAKQSIYRWRGGKAEQFIALPQFHESTHVISALTRKRLAEAAEVRDLDTNFRSLENIVHFNNSLIEYLSNELTAEGTAYRNEYRSASATQKTPAGKAGGYVEVNYLGPKDKEDVAYLQHTLTQIKDCLSAGYQFGEIAILIRSTSKEGSLIAEFLEKEGIPVATNDGYSIDSNPWVMCLLSMMRLMLHPGDTSAQVKIMRALTGLYQVPYEPWKYKTNRVKGKSFIDLQKFYRDINLPSTQFTGPKPSAYITCEMLALQYMPSKRNDLYVKTLLNTILKRGGTGINIDDFLTWWDSLKNKPGVPTNLESNRVQLMTFHKSKGLQFKVCILPIMSWKKDLGRDTRWINTSERFEKLPFTPLSMNNNLNGMGFESIKDKHDADVNFDNLNLIYVAVTRAEERLYITFDTYHSGYTGAAMARSCMILAEKLQSSNHFQINTIDDGKSESRKPEPNEAFCIKFGTPQQARDKVISLQEEKVVEPTQLPPNLWFDRFEVSKPDSMRSDSGARRLGNILHDTLSKAETIQDAGRQIQNYERSGAINTSESGRLQTLLSEVYSDAIFIELHQGAQRYSEREILSDGILLRPDLVLVKPESIAVVDFKSGTEDLKHMQQVATYMDHLRVIYNKNITGYVLYLNPVKWVKVQPANLPFSQKTLFD